MSDESFGMEAGSLLAIRRLCEQTPGLSRVWIFGSRSRGDHRERSDIDLVADAPGWSLSDSLAFADALKHLPMVYPVDCSWWQEPGLQPEFVRQVERDRRVLWEPRRHPVQAQGLGAISLKRFQTETLDTLGRYLDECKRHAAQGEAAWQSLRATEHMEEAAREASDFPKRAWSALKRASVLPSAYAGHPHSSRFDGAGRAIPNVCLKVPTGGGKTLLAAASVARVFGSYLARHTGLVLWVVPNEAIYRQTFKTLADRDHPYRQMLNVAGAGRVKILDKNSPLTRLDLDSHLCVMLLMLQSAARQSKETLRFFRDRGNVLGFLPREDDIEAHWKLLREVPNLDAYGHFGASAQEARAQKGSIVKSSLGNVMRLVRPMVVIDEGHHAYTENALRTLDGFNPSFMLELSATPRLASARGSGSNILVDVRGTDLDDAEMIKLPIKVNVQGWRDWQGCLGAAVRQLDALRHEAQLLKAETARYIRPILLVQVERTGADMRDAGFIHAEDAKAHLLQLGFTERQIAIKTSERNELAQPENIDLLSPACEVRAIVTKQALQEGWDCPFAYVLCALAAGRNPAAMTQLVGRILRLPHVAKTGREALDACYVLCFDADTAQVVRGIKNSLELEGMGDLAGSVCGEGDAASATPPIRLERRAQFARLRLFLPKVTWVEPGRPRRELVYESDVLAGVAWHALDPARLAHAWAPNAQGGRGQRFDIGLEILNRPALADAGHWTDTDPELDRMRMVRSLLDLAPNAWQVWGWVQSVVERLESSGFAQRTLAGSVDSLIQTLRVDLETERDRLAQAEFERLVDAGRIEFSLRADAADYELPRDAELRLAVAPAPLIRSDATLAHKSLLEPALLTPDMNRLEAAVGIYLDEQAALRWWHRNVAKTQYGLQGWKRHKVYPDFVFAHLSSDGGERMVLLETKGLHLEGGDTPYKQTLLDRLTRAFRDERFKSAEELALDGTGARLVCDLVFDSGWQGVLDQRHFQAAVAAGEQ